MPKPLRTFASVACIPALGVITLVSCAGPQPLDRAINPSDEQAYLASMNDAAPIPIDAFLAAKAAELHISTAKARSLDAALSTSVNPFHARRDPAAVSRGAVIYKHECAACHGAHADGRGPGLPAPVPSIDFHRTTMRMDMTFHGGAVKSWFQTINNGGTATATMPDGAAVPVSMPPFSDRLAREQIWLAITYLQSLDTDLPPKSKEGGS